MGLGASDVVHTLAEPFRVAEAPAPTVLIADGDGVGRRWYYGAQTFRDLVELPERLRDHLGSTARVVWSVEHGHLVPSAKDAERAARAKRVRAHVEIPEVLRAMVPGGADGTASDDDVRRWLAANAADCASVLEGDKELTQTLVDADMRGHMRRLEAHMRARGVEMLDDEALMPEGEGKIMPYIVERCAGAVVHIYGNDTDLFALALLHLHGLAAGTEVYYVQQYDKRIYDMRAFAESVAPADRAGTVAWLALGGCDFVKNVSYTSLKTYGKVRPDIRQRMCASVRGDAFDETAVGGYVRATVEATARADRTRDPAVYARQLHWLLHYWRATRRADVPDCEATVDEGGARVSVWGWMRGVTTGRVSVAAPAYIRSSPAA